MNLGARPHGAGTDIAAAVRVGKTMARYLALLVLATTLAACAEQPLVAPKPTTFQSKARTVTELVEAVGPDRGRDQ